MPAASPNTTTRRWFSRPASPDRSRAVAAAALLALAAACAFSPVVRVGPHRVAKVRVTSFNSFELDSVLQRGMFSEVLAFIDLQSADRRAESRVLESEGRALLAQRRYPEAREVLRRARLAFGSGSLHAANLAWAESQAAFQQGDAVGARDSARLARELTFPVPDGWLVYLDALAKRAPHLNRIEGKRTRLFFRYGRPRLPRFAVRLNDHAADAVLDTGAAITLVSEKAAGRWGVVPVEGSDAEGSGLHGSRFPARFGVIDTLEIGGIVIHDVPVGVIPDSALSFESSVGDSQYELLLGCHLLKEFRIVLDYQNRFLHLTPNEGLPTAADSPGANLFVVDGKPILRGSINGVGWFRLLVDTGSEFTLMHRAGARRFGSFMPQSPIEPITVHGIGKSRSQWGKVSDITFGVDAHQVFFKDVLITDDSETLDDAIVGSSFLDNFIVVLDFGHLRATLARPVEEEDEPEPGVRRKD